MNKLVAVVSTFALGISLVGCGLTDPVDSKAPSIELNAAIGTINAGTFKNVTGKITASEIITSVAYNITNSSGTAVTTITASGPSSSSAKTLDFKDNNAIKITVPSTQAAGEYNLKISATAGATADASFKFTVASSAPVGTPVTTATITAGSNGNATLGSSIDLDAGVSYLSAAAAANVSKLDLCYSSTGAGADKLGSPNWAKLSKFNYAINWTNPPATKFYKTTLTKAQFDAITTKEGIPAFDVANATAESYEATLNDVFIVKTTEDATVLVLINAKTDGESGSITVKTSK